LGRTVNGALTAPMRRYLVLTDEARGHPFRRALPPQRVVHVPEQDSDLKLFALSFTAFFVCFYTFLF
jgi:hypothetical protein